ncbi:MAG: endolytic transglycosylase MltG [Pseudomonadota bacterium]
MGLRWVAGTCLLLAVCLGLIGAYGWQQFQQFLGTPLGAGAGQAGQSAFQLRVAPGDPVRAVLARLEAQSLTRNDWRWRWLLRQDPVTIQAGEYEIPPGTTPHAFLRLLEQGAVIQYRFTLVEGWNWWQLRDALKAEARLAVDEALLTRESVMAAIGSAQTDPEGWFLPETYAYTADDDALDVLRRAHGAMQDALAEAWNGRVEALPLASQVELLTLASIIEKESSVAAERPEIAGVFIRRLEQNWRLETDPTVIYGIGEAFDGDIKSRDLRAATPYNTYVIRGLPPTPIAMPGVDSLKAAAAPAPGRAMFFVADGQGGHVFSETLAEHNRAVQDMLRRLRAKRDDEPKPSNAEDGDTSAVTASALAERSG